MAYKIALILRFFASLDKSINNWLIAQFKGILSDYN